ncbi:unnamed protein product [Pieris brassicae]|uniref:Uncharacterized protein n=1 Tax=Pieris brassicae TaxID=7116 RepID=A0A9P0TEW0_PIEBR|nr:unnamed protein product [Pieris brassicae]
MSSASTILNARFKASRTFSDSAAASAVWLRALAGGLTLRVGLSVMTGVGAGAWEGFTAADFVGRGGKASDVSWGGPSVTGGLVQALFLGGGAGAYVGFAPAPRRTASRPAVRPDAGLCALGARGHPR